MLDKIILSRDKKIATIVLDTHSYSISSDGDVMELVQEIVVEPGQRAERSEEITEVIELQLSLFEDAA